MPIYEYRCQHCGQRVALLRSVTDTSSPRCSICGKENLTRLISRVSVVRSETDGVRDMSWVDKELARRIKKKASGKLNPAFKATLDRMESE
jgi:putative FmdB family regulatory protein